ncbi:MAG TPA: MOSC domain-containing protein [Candidatus Acidoferrum sp.]|nr:MOSC domain-containing protein [Candidatus Acidoferrum sp.]
MAKILNLFRAPKRRAAMEELREARLVENAGIDGCAHARPGGKRQVLLVDIETLRTMGLAPGVIRENITTEGLDVSALKIGQKLRAGEVELQVSAVCEPCELMEEIRAGLMAELQGRRGMLCRVLRGGEVKRGDSIELEQSLSDSD